MLPLGRGQSLLYGQQSILPKVRSKPRIDEKILDRATKTWQGFESSNTGWKKQLVKWSNKALERIPYEEWSLRTIPATDMYKRTVKESFQPKLGAHIAPEKIEDFGSVEPVKLVHVGDSTEAIATVKKLASQGLEHHRKLMWRTLIGIPFTIPFAIVPIVPNIPFFYMAFRLYCHWQAYQGAKHLQYLIDNKQLEPVHLAALDATYNSSEGALNEKKEERLARIFESHALNTELQRAKTQLAKEDQEDKKD